MKTASEEAHQRVDSVVMLIVAKEPISSLLLRYCWRCCCNYAELFMHGKGMLWWMVRWCRTIEWM